MRRQHVGWTIGGLVVVFGAVMTQSPSVSAQGQLNAPLNVSATVGGGGSGCTYFGASGLDFGDYNPEVPSVAPFYIDIQCSSGVFWQTTDDGGPRGPDPEGNRQMVGMNTGASLPYRLGNDPNCLDPWVSYGPQLSGEGRGSVETFGAYGCIDPGNAVPPDTYADSVGLILVF